MSWSEIKKKKEEEEKKRASKKSNSDVSRIANALTGSLWKDVGQNIITSERNAEIKRKQEQEEKRKNSYTQNMPSTYKRTIQPSVTQTMSRDNNVSIVKQSDLKNQKLEKAQENSTWGNIVNFVKNTGRTLENIKTGAYTNLIGLSQTAIRDISDVDKAYSEGKSAIRNTLLPLLGDKGKQVNNYLNEQEEKNYAKRNEALNSGLQVLSKEKQKANEDIQRNVLGAKLTDSSVATKMAEIAPSIGQQIPGFAFNAISPVASLLYFKGSAEANYYDDAISRGMEEKQAKIYSKLMSYVEAGTEQLSVGNISKGGKTITTALKGAKEEGLKKGLKAGFDVFKETAKEETANTLKSAFKDYGIGVAEEAFQEAITEPIQEFTAMKVAGEDKADWNNMWQRMLQSGFDGALSSAILAGANLGISSCQGIVTKIENGQDFTTEEYNTAIKDASQKIDIEKLTTDQIKEKVNQLKGELQQPQVRVNENVDQEIKTSQNGFSQAEKTEALRQEARNKLESIKQNYDENSYNQMQQFIETAPSEKALNQVINDLNKEAETKQVAPLKQKQEVQLPMKQETQNKSFEDVAFEAMSNYESNEVESPLKNRDMDSIGKQTKVNAYQYDNPKVKPYFQEMAQQMGEDLAYIASPENRSTKKGGGTKLSTSTKAMDILHNEQGYSYNQIAQGLQNIIDDKGSENNAISKKIELVIDEQLRNGYTNALGKNIEPNQEYINTIQGDKEVQSNQENLKTNNKENSKDIDKQKQFDIIQKSNPMTDDYHVGIRNIEDIKTFEEAMQDDESFVYGDYTLEDAQRDLGRGKVTVYSSNPIEQGGFVSTSQNMAKDYAGDGEIYSKEVNINDVAWINGDEGQYAKVENSSQNNISKLEERLSGDELLNTQDFIDEIKSVGAIVDENGYVTLYHTTTTKNAENIRNTGKMSAKEDGIFFSTKKNSQQSEGRGDVTLKFKIPAERLQLDDIFDDNADVRIPLNSKNSTIDVSQYLVNDSNLIENKNNANYEDNYQKAFKDILNKSESEIRTQLNGIIDNIYIGKMPEGNQVVLNVVPENLQKLGVHNRPMLMAPRELRNAILSKDDAIKIGYPIGKNDSYHQLGKDKFYQVLNNLSDPVMVIKENDNKIIVFTEQFDYKGKQIIVPIEINTNSEYNTLEVQDVNIFKSMHGRSSISNYINNLLNKSSEVLYKNTKKIQSLFDNRKVQYPEAINSVSNNSIPQNNQNVKSDNTNINNMQNNQENIQETRLPMKEKQEVKAPLKQENIKKSLELPKNIDYTENRNLTREIFEDNIAELKNFRNLSEYVNKGNDINNFSTEYMKRISEFQKKHKSDFDGRKNINISSEIYDIDDNLVKLTTTKEDDKLYIDELYVEKQRQGAGSKVVDLLKKYANKAGLQLETSDELSTAKGFWDKTLNRKEIKAPLKQGNVQQYQNNNTPGENINWNEIERPEENRKFRKHYKSIIESDNTTAEAKSIAKELMGTDTYEPETNKGQLAQADQRIMTSSPEVELQALRSRVLNGERITSVDIAVGERLIQYFSKTGSAEQLQDAIQTTALAGTSTGQTLQALTILNHQTPQGQVTWLQRSIDKMNKELAKKKGGTITTDADGNIQIVNKQGKDITNKVDLFNLTPEMMNKIMQSENQEQMLQNIDEVYEELGQQVPKSMLEKVDSWRYFSMLANMRTHGRNMIGNFAMGKMQRVKDKIAGGIEDVVSKFNPEMERTKTLRRADKKTKEFAKNDFKNVEVQSRLELNESKFNPQSRLQNARRTFKSDAMENTLGRLFNLNDKLLEAEDGIGLKAGYQKALADYITANKIDVDNITDAQLNKARNYAVQQAKEATFHQANAIASAVAQFENKNLATKLFTGAVLPFKKTPMNVAKAGMEYSPLQIAKSATVDLVNLRKGNISVNQYIDNLSKGMTGTGIALVGYALANAGILKASGGDDKDKEKYEEEQGKQSYSIQIAGKTYSLDWLAPTGIPLFIGAETHKLFNQEETEKSTEKKSEEDRLNQAIKGASNLLNAGATAINPMSEMSMISGLTSALSSYNTSDNLGSLGNIMTNAGKSYVNQFFPTLMGQVAKTTDKYERTTKSTATGTIGKAVDQTINQIKNKIPGLRQTLPIKTDIWGKELKQEVNLPLRAINNFINPATVKNVSTDKVDMELNKLYEENHSSSLLPDILTKTVQLNKQTYRLSNKEYAEFTKNYGQTSHKLIENFIKTSDYNKLTQEQKETAISNIYSYAKEQNKMDYAKKVNETVKPSTLYTTMKEIEKNGGKQSEYLNYLAKTKGMSKEIEKNKVLADSNYSNRTKEIIYTNGTGKDDNLYNNLLSKSHINMTEYLDYKDKVSSKVFSADKDKNGKTVTGSAKAKVINYLNNNITGVGNRLLIAGKSYALQNNEKQKLAQYINSIANTREERVEIYKQLDKNFYVRNGKVYMRVSK